jgi:outer membrane protein, multidrug efflux system
MPGPVVMALLLAGCSQIEPYANPRFPFLSGYNAQKSAAPVLLSNTAWWNGFQDPVLDQLVTLALADNLNIAAARERVEAARASSRAIASPLSVTGTLDPRLQNAGGHTEEISEGRLGFSWMLDPYGQRRALMKGAGARIEAADAETDAARLLTLYNLCNSYVDLRYYQQLLDLRRQERVSRRRTLSLAHTMLERGSGTELDVTRATARLSDVEAQIPALEAQVQVQMNQIAVLAGRVPGQLGVDLAKHGRQPQSGLTPDVGIPADLLRNRPDIRIAERLYYAAVADTGVAKAALFPRLSLGGAITLTSVGGGAAGHEAYFGPVLALPALPGDAAHADVDARRSAARLAYTTWKSTVLEAIGEVENALLEYQASRKSRVAAERSLVLYTRAQTMVGQLLDSGDARLDDLIDANQSVTQAANSLADSKRQQGLDFIALNVRLGSGNRVAPVMARVAGN